MYRVGAARVVAQGSQIYLRCGGSNSRHGTILNGQRDEPGDGGYNLWGRGEANELEGFATLLHLLDRMVNDFDTPELCYQEVCPGCRV